MQNGSKRIAPGSQGIGGLALLCAIMLMLVASVSTGAGPADQSAPAISASAATPEENIPAAETVVPSPETDRQSLTVIPPLRLSDSPTASPQGVSGSLVSDFLRQSVGGGDPQAAARPSRPGSGSARSVDHDDRGLPMWAWGVFAVAVGGGAYAIAESSGGGGGGGGGTPSGGTTPETAPLAFWLFENSSDDFDMIITDPTGRMIRFSDRDHYRQDSLSSPGEPDVAYWLNPPTGTYTIAIQCYANNNPDDDKSITLLVYRNGMLQETLASFTVPAGVEDQEIVRVVTYVYQPGTWSVEVTGRGEDSSRIDGR